ncbi:MAG: hypothetical protein U0R19_26590 [Bryobacteraceae bacterium]
MRILLALILAPQAFAAPFYTLTEIGTLGGPFSIGRAINSSGRVAGNSTLPSNTSHAISWSGSLTDLTPAHPNRSLAYGINDSGQIVGIADVDPSSSADRAFYFDGGPMQFFNSLAAVRSYAWDINNSGVAVGTLQEPFVGLYGVVWNSLTGTPQPLPVQIGTFTEALAINDAGEMAGQIQGPGLSHAMRLAGGTVQDLGTLGGSASTAYAISENGLIAGTSDIAGGAYHAFVWDGTTMHDLGALAGGYSVASGVNSAGFVAGYSYDAPFNIVGTLWEGSTMHIMDDLVVNLNGRQIGQLLAINESGQITGMLRNGIGIRLDPVVPEPGPLGICGAGLALLFARRYFRVSQSTGKRARVNVAVRK